MTRAATEYDDGPPTQQVMTYRGRNLRYLNLARKVAHCSLHEDYRHGAVLVKGGSVISTSCNKNQGFVLSTMVSQPYTQSWVLFSVLIATLQKVRPSMFVA